jgi:hypothetical protein
MTVFKTLFGKTESNAEIAASASEIFGQDTASQEARTKFGSFNSLTIFSKSDKQITVNLNDGNIYSFGLFANAAFQLEPEEGLFFDWVKITNSIGAAVAASELTLTWARKVPIPKT